jgi:hypothetical protein
MKRYMQAALIVIILMGGSMTAFAGDVRTDYDHTVNFRNSTLTRGAT